MALGEQDVLHHTNPHNQWHKHVQESRLWHNVSYAVATDGPATIDGNNMATIRRNVTNGGHQEAEKLHEPDIAATLNQHYQLQHHHTLAQQQKPWEKNAMKRSRENAGRTERDYFYEERR